MDEAARIEALRRAAEADPTAAAGWRALADALAASGEATEAVAARCAALALEARSAAALHNLATVYFRAGHYGPATRWYRLALVLDPELVEANQNLAVIHDVEGRPADARRHRDAAFRKQCLFVEPSGALAAPTVLILAAAGIGNVPIDDLLPRERINRITWFIDYATPDQAARLPRYDLVFNAIGDPDIAERTLLRAASFLDGRPEPVLNPPAHVLRTRRDQMPGLLAGIDHLVVPPVLRVDREALPAAALPDELADAGISFPILVRPLGSHGGKDVSLIATPDALATLDPGDAERFYITAFHDCRAADGHYRKYRMIFVDRRPYPYHLAISERWLVHYFSADMAAAPWKHEEERRFLEAPATVLAPHALAAIETIGRRLDLDYGGVDFALLADGRVLFFEANALMLVHLREPAEPFPHKHACVPRIFRAFETMMAARLPVRAGTLPA
jgi:tetratricopeptide (TPR) repeat protein